MELSASHDDNVSRAEAGADIKSDNIVGLGINIQRAWLLTPTSGILLRSHVKFDQYQHYDDLSHITANAGVDYRFQPMVGYSAPVFDVGTTLERYAYSNSDIRDGTALQADVSVSSHITDRIKLLGGVGTEKRWADQGEIYVWQRDRIYAGAHYRFSSTATLYANVSRSDGDQVFTSSPNLALFLESKAVTNDPVFGARRAYRVDATADVFELGDSIAISGETTLDIGVRYFDISTSDDWYGGTELRASLLYRFK
ncbi:MAG TPA: hypothetical protein VIE69_00580 [Methylophilaceae bacterium]|jgi:hypothetical protein